MTARRRTLYWREIRVGISEMLVALLAIAIGAYSIFESLELGYVRFGIPGAGFFPLWIGIALVLAGLVLAVRGWFRRDRYDASDWGQVGITITAIVALLLLAPLIGLIWAIFIFTAVMIPCLGSISLRVSIAIAAAASFVIWSTLDLWLGIPLPSGTLWGP